MEISFSDLLQAGVGVIALFILYQFIQNTSRDAERKDKAYAFEQDRQQKYDERMLLLFATITHRQTEDTATITKSGVDSETRMSSQLIAAENNIKGRVTASGDASTAAIEKLYKLTDSAFQILLARPPDPMAAEKYDRALAILTAQVEAVKDDLAGVKTDTAANTDARVLTAEMSAVVAPSEVVITDVSPSAVETIVSAMGAGAATEGGESETPKASGF